MSLETSEIRTDTNNCMHCGKEFTFPMRKGVKPKLCSEECRVANRKLKRKPRKKIVRKHKCKTCNGKKVVKEKKIITA